MERKRRRKRVRRAKKQGVGLKVCLIIILMATAFGAWQVFPEIAMRATETAGRISGKSEIQNAASELTLKEEEVETDFYYQQLNGKEKTAYKELLQGVREMEENITLHVGKEEDAGKIYEALLYDRPELFWCTGDSHMTVYSEYTEFSPSYSCTAEQKEERQKRILQAEMECWGQMPETDSEYEKIKAVFEYIVNTVEYDETASDNQNIYSALVNHRSVCAGYSRSAQYLLKSLGIECIYVTGDVISADGKRGAHAWNIVKCEDAYYQMDVTFGDPLFLENENREDLPEYMINYEYLCCTDEQIQRDHIPDEEAEYPVCDSDDLNYYKRNGMYYETFDPDEILGKMKEGIADRQEMFVCSFKDEEVYSQAVQQMIEELLPQAAQNLAERYGLEQVRYTYAEDKVQYIFSVFWNYNE